MTERRPPKELFEALLDYENDDPTARPLAELTDAEVDAELRAHGVDPEGARVRGALHATEVLNKLGAPPAGAGAAPAAKAGVAGYVVAGSVVVAIGVVVARLVFGGHDVPTVPDATPAPDAAPDTGSKKRTDALLVAAREACAREAWGDCLQALDHAHAEDPTADQGTDAKELRAAAVRGLVKDGGPQEDKKGGR